MEASSSTSISSSLGSTSHRPASPALPASPSSHQLLISSTSATPPLRPPKRSDAQRCANCHESRTDCICKRCLAVLHNACSYKIGDDSPMCQECYDKIYGEDCSQEDAVFQSASVSDKQPPLPTSKQQVPLKRKREISASTEAPG